MQKLRCVDTVRSKTWKRRIYLHLLKMIIKSSKKKKKEKRRGRKKLKRKREIRGTKDRGRSANQPSLVFFRSRNVCVNVHIRYMCAHAYALNLPQLNSIGIRANANTGPWPGSIHCVEIMREGGGRAREESVQSLTDRIRYIPELCRATMPATL